MRPVADREHPHDVDLQRDHRAGAQRHGKIERDPAAAVERDVIVGQRRGRELRRRRAVCSCKIPVYPSPTDRAS